MEPNPVSTPPAPQQPRSESANVTVSEPKSFFGTLVTQRIQGILQSGNGTTERQGGTLYFQHALSQVQTGNLFGNLQVASIRRVGPMAAVLWPRAQLIFIVAGFCSARST